MQLPIRFVLFLTLGVPALTLPGCKAESNVDREVVARNEARAQTRARQVQATCASNATNDRLKQVLFDDAIRIRNADPVNLDTLATYSSVRMERPTVKSRDEALDVTVCSGLLVLQLPPGAERAFAGARNLRAEVEYAAQAAADGSGMVYRIKGAEPIVYKLAAFDLRRQDYRVPAPSRVAPPPTARPAPERTEPAPPPPPPPSATQPRQPVPRPEAASTARTYPSFDCRRARTRSERLVCSDEDLAALDRAMSSRFYSALSNADRTTRAELRRSRDRFLAYRDRCPTVACVDEAYRDRMDEIRDIAGN